MMGNYQSAYKQISVNTSTPGRLLIMLYDGLIRYIKSAMYAIEQNEIETAHKQLIRAQDIVLELQTTLQHQQAPELCDSLESLYQFFYVKLVEANRTKSTHPLDEILGFIQELRDAFVQADHQIATERQG